MNEDDNTPAATPPASDWENSVEYKLSHRESKRPVLAVTEDEDKADEPRDFFRSLFGSREKRS